MPLHVMVLRRDEAARVHSIFSFDKDERWLDEHVVRPRSEGRDAFIDGQVVAWRDVQQIRIAQTDETAERLMPRIRARRMKSSSGATQSDEWRLIHEGRDVTERFISGPPPEIADRESQRTSSPVDRRTVMVVYGQDREAADALFDWLRAIGLAPQEWGALTHASGSASPFIGRIVDQAFQAAQAVVVLFTPDERAVLREELAAGETSWRLQARPNVLFEAGMAFATHPDRTVLVVLGRQDLPSDLAGRHYVRLSGAESLHDLANRLEAAGCDVSRTGSHWLNPNRFPDRAAVRAAPDRSDQDKT